MTELQIQAQLNGVASLAQKHGLTIAGGWSNYYGTRLTFVIESQLLAFLRRFDVLSNPHPEGEVTDER